MAEQYSVQAENLMKTAVEEYVDILKDIKVLEFVRYKVGEGV